MLPNQRGKQHLDSIGVFELLICVTAEYVGQKHDMRVNKTINLKKIHGNWRQIHILGCVTMRDFIRRLALFPGPVKVTAHPSGGLRARILNQSVTRPDVSGAVDCWEALKCALSHSAHNRAPKESPCRFRQRSTAPCAVSEAPPAKMQIPGECNSLHFIKIRSRRT